MHEKMGRKAVIEGRMSDMTRWHTSVTGKHLGDRKVDAINGGGQNASENIYVRKYICV